MVQNVNIFTANFGDRPIRFIYLPNHKALFVSKDDIFAAIQTCWTASVPFDALPGVENVMGFFADDSEQAATLLDIDTIGPVVNVYSAGNLISSLADLHDVDHPDLRESAFRINTLFRWYTSTGMIGASRFYNIHFLETLSMAKDHLDKHNPSLPVSVTQSDGVWIAECDELGLVTEADDFESLRERVWEIAPELAELNGLEVPVTELRLNFSFVDSVAQYRMVG